MASTHLLSIQPRIDNRAPICSHRKREGAREGRREGTREKGRYANRARGRAAGRDSGDMCAQYIGASRIGAMST